MKFRCVMCGNVQSGASVCARNPEIKLEDTVNWIFFACEGRHTDGVGCDWTLGGLFQLHRLEVVWPPDDEHPEDSVHRVFEFADDPVGDWVPSGGRTPQGETVVTND
jgi:hypothetical protein